MRDSKLGALYSSYLKKYRLIRIVAPWLWRTLYLAYQTGWIYGRAKKLTLNPLWSHARHRPRATLVAPETVSTPQPDVWPRHATSFLVKPHSDYEFPEIYTTELDDAIVTGGTNLVIVGESVIHHDLYDFNRDYTSEELNLKTRIWPKHRRIAWMMEADPIEELQIAASFTDACSTNYAHWMTEILPRIDLFCLTSEFRVPLIIDGNLHVNIRQSLDAVVNTGRRIIEVSPGRCIRVRRLLMTSVAGYTPFERRTNRTGNHSHGRFSSYALRSMRSTLQAHSRCSTALLPRKVYLRRNASVRNIINADEVESTLVSRGFSIVEPELMDHADQVAMFMNADVVVGPTGAAIANIIFCRPTTRIVVLLPAYRNTSYWYWQNIACAVGNKVNYVLGAVPRGKRHGIHSDYYIEMQDLINAVEGTR